MSDDEDEPARSPVVHRVDHPVVAHAEAWGAGQPGRDLDAGAAG